MDRINVDIMGIGDVHTEKIRVDNKMVYYSGSKNSSQRYGVGIILSRNIN